MRKSRVLRGRIAAVAVLASASCAASGGNPERCPRGDVLAHAPTLGALKDVMIRQQRPHGAKSIEQYDVNADIRVFVVEDQRGRRLYYLNVWPTDSGEWVYSKQVTCA